MTGLVFGFSIFGTVFFLSDLYPNLIPWYLAFWFGWLTNIVYYEISRISRKEIDQ